MIGLSPNRPAILLQKCNQPPPRYGRKLDAHEEKLSWHQPLNVADMWQEESTLGKGHTDSLALLRLPLKEGDIVFIKESLQLTNVFEGFQVQADCLFKPPLSFHKRTPERCCTEFLTTGNPALPLKAKLKLESYISLCLHLWLLPAYASLCSLEDGLIVVYDLMVYITLVQKHCQCQE